jgi:glycosyltransferase involved in cell wall biosynthesis
MDPLVSIVIDNHNYERFVAAAIESALAQTYPRVEVLVVDDGSTDGSWGIISRYGDRLKAIRKANGGQASAVNVGYEACSGDIVIFLDSDDFLRPEAAASVVSAWAADCVKVQYRLSIVDADGKRTGALPAVNIPLPSGDLVPMIARAGGYIWPVTSGNAFNRSVLERLMPVPEQDFGTIADGYLNPLAPFYGPVISLQEELAAYRMHGSNRWHAQTGPEQLRRHIDYDLLAQRYTLETAARVGRKIPADLAIRDWEHVLHRLSYLRLDPAGHPIPSDTRRGLARAAVGAVFRSPQLAGAERVFYAAVLIAVAAVPRPLAAPVVEWANTSKPRPAWMRFARRAMRLLRWSSAGRGSTV